MIFRMFAFCIWLFPSLVLAHFYIEWERGVKNTDLTVNGIIKEKRRVFNDERYFNYYQGSKYNFPQFKTVKIDTTALDDSNKITFVTYYIVSNNTEKWIFSKRSTVWTVVYPIVPRERKYNLGNKKQLKNYQYLKNTPDELYVKEIDKTHKSFFF